MALQWDDILNGQVTLSGPHYRVHEGKSFMASYRTPDGSNVVDNGYLDIVLMPVTGVNAHLTFEAAAGNNAELFFYEGPTTTGGTVITPRNMNRTFSDQTHMYIKHTPSVTTLGTLLLNAVRTFGTMPFGAGGTARDDTEFICAAATKYLLRLYNRAGTAQPLGWQLQWYEVPA
jgi:hypothetical protein